MPQSERLANAQIDVERARVDRVHAVRVVGLQKISQQDRRLPRPAAGNAAVGDQRVETGRQIRVAMDTSGSIIDDRIEIIILTRRYIEWPP